MSEITLSQLPVVALRTICSHLSARDGCRLRATCRELREKLLPSDVVSVCLLQPLPSALPTSEALTVLMLPHPPQGLDATSRIFWRWQRRVLRDAEQCARMLRRLMLDKNASKDVTKALIVHAGLDVCATRRQIVVKALSVPFYNPIPQSEVAHMLALQPAEGGLGAVYSSIMNEDVNVRTNRDGTLSTHYYLTVNLPHVWTDELNYSMSQ